MDFKRFVVLHNDHDVPRGIIFASLKMIESQRRKGENVVEFDREIGFNNLVEVSDDEEFYEEVRGNRPYASRFVRNRLPEATNKVCVVWQRINEDLIRVITAYFTHSHLPGCPDEPGNILRKMAKGVKYSEDELRRALEFWSSHAFVETIPNKYL